MDRIGTSNVSGRVRAHRVTADVWTPTTELNPNLVLYQWGELVGKLLTTGDAKYRVSGMYLEFENVASPGIRSACRRLVVTVQLLTTTISPAASLGIICEYLLQLRPTQTKQSKQYWTFLLAAAVRRGCTEKPSPTQLIQPFLGRRWWLS